MAKDENKGSELDLNAFAERKNLYQQLKASRRQKAQEREQKFADRSTPVRRARPSDIEHINSIQEQRQHELEQDKEQLQRGIEKMKKRGEGHETKEPEKVSLEKYMPSGGSGKSSRKQTLGVKRVKGEET